MRGPILFRCQRSADGLEQAVRDACKEVDAQVSEVSEESLRLDHRFSGMMDSASAMLAKSGDASCERSFIRID